MSTQKRRANPPSTQPAKRAKAEISPFSKPNILHPSIGSYIELKTITVKKERKSFTKTTSKTITKTASSTHKPTPTKTSEIILPRSLKKASIPFHPPGVSTLGDLLRNPPPRPTPTKPPTPRQPFIDRAALLTARTAFLQSIASLGGPPVRIINTVDSEPCPPNVTIINSYCLSHSNPPVPELDTGFLTGCDHAGCCTDTPAFHDNGKKRREPDQPRCECAAAYYNESQVPSPYDQHGRLTQVFRDGVYEHHAVYECGDECGCDESCPLKVVLKGRKLPLDIIKTVNRGWGIRCPVPIKAGTFIDIYAGDLIWRGSRKDGEYIFDLDHFNGTGRQPSDDELAANGGESYTRGGTPLLSIDGKMRGSLMRFVNNSCLPNCRVVSVLPSTSAAQTSRYFLAFFASKDIPAGEELTVKYDPSAAKLRRGGKTCFCGTRRCNGHLWNNSVFADSGDEEEEEDEEWE